MKSEYPLFFERAMPMSKRLKWRIYKGQMSGSLWAIKWVEMTGHWQCLLIKTLDVYVMKRRATDGRQSKEG